MRVPLLQPASDYGRSLIRKLTVFRQTGEGRSWRTLTFSALAHIYIRNRRVSHIPNASKFIDETDVVIILPFYWCRVCAHVSCYTIAFETMARNFSIPLLLSHVKKDTVVFLVGKILKKLRLFITSSLFYTDAARIKEWQYWHRVCRSTASG